MIKNIIWLASYPKSGNTWLRIFLSNLLSKDDTPININRLFKTPIASSRYLFDQYIGVNSSDLTEQEINTLRPLFYREISQSSRVDRFMKVHDAWRRTTDGQEIFPSDITKKTIYLIRNPLDILISLSHHRNTDFKQTASFMNSANSMLCGSKNKLSMQLSQNLLSWSEHIESWTNSGLDLKVVRYEDLYSSPISTFSSIVKYLQLEFSKSQIEEAIIFSGFNEISDQEKKHDFVERPIHMKAFFRYGKPNQWEKMISKDVYELIVKFNRENMRRYGYLDNN